MEIQKYKSLDEVRKDPVFLAVKSYVERTKECLDSETFLYNKEVEIKLPNGELLGEKSFSDFVYRVL